MKCISKAQFHLYSKHHLCQTARYDYTVLAKQHWFFGHQHPCSHHTHVEISGPSFLKPDQLARCELNTDIFFIRKGRILLACFKIIAPFWRKISFVSYSLASYLERTKRANIASRWGCTPFQSLLFAFLVKEMGCFIERSRGMIGWQGENGMRNSDCAHWITLDWDRGLLSSCSTARMDMWYSRV